MALDRYQRRLFHDKGELITTGKGPPSTKEGKSGSITIRNVDGYIKLYAKYKDIWYETNLGDALTIGKQHLEHIEVDAGGVDIRDGETSKAHLGSTLRIGEDSTSKSALRVTADGALSIGKKGASPNFSVAADGSVSISASVSVTPTSATVAVGADSIVFTDTDNSNALSKDSFSNFATAIAGGGLSASSGVLSIDTSLPDVNSIGESGDTLTAAGHLSVAGNLTVTGTTDMAMDSTSLGSHTITVDSAAALTIETASGTDAIIASSLGGGFLTIGSALNNNAHLYINQSTTTKSGLKVYRLQSTSDAALAIFHTDHAGDDSDTVQIKNDGEANALTVFNDGNQIMSVGNAGTDSVIIGTPTTADQILHIHDASSPQVLIATSDNTEFLRVGVGETAGDMIIGWDDSDSLHLGVYSSKTDTSINTAMKINPDKTVDIGTSSVCDGNLGIYDGASDCFIMIRAATAYDAYIDFRTNGNTTNSIIGFDQSAAALKIVHSDDITSTLGISVKDTGFVGIGVVDPSHLLTLTASAARMAFTRASSYTFSLGIHDASTNTLTVKDNGDSNTLMAITAAGNVGLGGIADPDTLLELSETNADTILRITTLSDDAAHIPTLQFNKGEEAALTGDTDADDVLGAIEFSSVPTTNGSYTKSAEILVKQDESAGTSYNSARMEFKVGTKTSGPVSAMTIKPTGSIGLGSSATSPTDNLYINNGTSDVTLRLDGNGSDKYDWRIKVASSGDPGTFEIQDYSSGAGWDSAITILSAGKVGIGKTPTVILDVSGDTNIDGTLTSDGLSVAGTSALVGTLTVGVDDTGHDVTFFGASSGKKLLWDESADELVLVGTDTKLSFYDAAGGENISANASGVLSIAAGSEIDLTATSIDVNGAVDMSSTLTVAGAIDITNPLDSSNATGDTGALRVEGGASIAKKLYVGTDLDVAGTANLDVVDIDGAVDIAENVTIAENKKIIFDTADTYIYANTDNPEDLVFGANADILLEPDGYVGINVSDPDTALEVMAGTSSQLKLSFDGTDNATFGVNTSGHLTITPSGSKVLIADDDSIGSSTFVSGFAGNGWIVDDGTTADATFDNLNIRSTMSVYELLIQQIRATNGSVMITSCAKVESVSGLAADDDDGTITFEPAIADTCPFVANDIIMCQQVNPGALVAGNAAGNASNIIKKMVYKVASVSDNVCTVENIGYDNLEIPVAGDEFVRIGNTSTASRQNVMYLTSDDDKAPFIDMKADVDSYADWYAEASTKLRLGRLDGLTAGGTNEYGLWAGPSTTNYIKAGSSGVFIKGDEDTYLSAGANKLEFYDGNKKMDVTGGNITMYADNGSTVISQWDNTNITLGGTVSTDTNCLQLSTGGVRIYGQANTAYADITSSAITLKQDANHYTVINGDGLNVYDGGAKTAVFGATTTIGEVGASKHNINLTASSIQFRENTDINAEIDGADVVLGTSKSVHDAGSGSYYSHTNASSFTIYGKDNDTGIFITSDGLSIKHDGTAKISMDSSGDASFTGAITANSGTIAGTVTVGGTALSTIATNASDAAGWGNHAASNYADGTYVSDSGVYTGTLTAEQINTGGAAFLPTHAWLFHNKDNSFTVLGQTKTNSAYWLHINSSGTDPVLRTPTINIDGYLNRYIKIKWKRTAGSGWDGKVFWTGDAGDENSGRVKHITDASGGSASSDWHYTTLDMWSLNTGGTAWKDDDSITRFRLDFGSSSSDEFHIAYIMVGDISVATPNTYIDSGGIYTGTINANQMTVGTLSADVVDANTIKGLQLDIGGDDHQSFHVDTDGNMWSGQLTMDGNEPFSVTSAGVLKAESGTIGGWTLSDAALYNGRTTIDNTTSGIFIGLTGISAGGTGAPTFKVTDAGVLTATSGTIGGWSISNTKISTGVDASYMSLDKGNLKIQIGEKSGIDANYHGVHIGSDGISLGAGTPFKVTKEGVLTTNSGYIGDWVIDSGHIRNSAYNVGIDASYDGAGIKLSNASSGSGNALYNGDQVLQGLSMVWHKSGNAGHLVFGQLSLCDDPTPALKTGYYGIQMGKYVDGSTYKEVFALGANTAGENGGWNDTYCKIAGWTFDDKSIYHYQGNNWIWITNDSASVWPGTNSGASGGQINMYNNDTKSMVSIGNIYKHKSNQGIALFTNYENNLKAFEFSVNDGSVSGESGNKGNITARIASWDFGQTDGSGNHQIKSEDGNMILTASANSIKLNGQEDGSVEMWYTNDDNWGMHGKDREGNTNFRLGNTNRIAGWVLDYNRLYSVGASGLSDGAFTTAGMVIGATGYISAKNFYIGSNGSAKFNGTLEADAVSSIASYDITNIQLKGKVVIDNTSSNITIGNNQTNAGSHNIGLGFEAGKTITSGTDNVMLGSLAGAAITDGDKNIIIGKYAAWKYSASNNVCIGEAAGAQVKNNNNVYIGFQAGPDNANTSTSGGYNIAIGNVAGVELSSGQNNILLGSTAGANLATASKCVVIGGLGDTGNTSWDSQLYISNGDGSLTYITGHSTGISQVNMANNGYVGRSSSTQRIKYTTDGIIIYPSSASVGQEFYGSGNIKLTLFNNAIGAGGGEDANIKMDTTGFLSVVSSDGRMKISGDIYSDALSKINLLKPRYYKWKEGYGEDASLNRIGFIAQEIEDIIPEAVVESPTNIVNGKSLGDGGGRRNFSNRALIAVLTKAVQELSAKVDELERKLN